MLRHLIIISSSVPQIKMGWLNRERQTSVTYKKRPKLTHNKIGMIQFWHVALYSNFLLCIVNDNSTIMNKLDSQTWHVLINCDKLLNIDKTSKIHKKLGFFSEHKMIKWYVRLFLPFWFLALFCKRFVNYIGGVCIKKFLNNITTVHYMWLEMLYLFGVIFKAMFSSINMKLQMSWWYLNFMWVTKPSIMLSSWALKQHYLHFMCSIIYACKWEEYYKTEILHNWVPHRNIVETIWKKTKRKIRFPKENKNSSNRCV